MSQLGATPDGSKILSGTGRVLIDRLDAAGLRTGQRFVGEVSDFKLSPNDQTIDIYSHVDAARGLLARNRTRAGADFSIELREMGQKNWALAMSGSEQSLVQTSGSFGVGAGDPVGGAAVVCKGGNFYPVSKLAIATSPTPVLKHTTVGGTVVPTTDYYVDYASGLVYVIPGGVADNKVLFLEYTYGALTRNSVSGIDSTVTCYVRFIGEPTNGPIINVEIWKGVLSPSGDLSLIGDDYASLTVKGTCLADYVNHPTVPFFQIW